MKFVDTFFIGITTYNFLKILFNYIRYEIT